MVLADEVTDCAYTEQISLVLRFVDTHNQIREDFLDFISVERITGEAISSAILKSLNYLGICIQHCRGQGYDGAANMSSSKKGVQAKIREASPLAFYTHCQSHQLNLCVVKSCSIAAIKKATSTISEIAKFFHCSPKRQRFFEEVISSCVQDTTKKQKLKDVCKTRWVERVNAFTTFFDLYPMVIKTMEGMSEGNGFPNWSWDSDTLTKANAFLHAITTFDFVVTFCIAMRVLSILRGVTVKLQKQCQDILAAFDPVSDVQLELQLMRDNSEEEFPQAHYSG